MCTENYHWHHDYIRLAWDSGFTFNVHKTKSNLDWSSIGLLDVDRIIRDRDVAVVEKHIGTILNYCLDEEQTRILEPTFVKVFQLSQLSVQYLQFCKKYLDNTVVLLKKEIGRCKEENSDLKDKIEQLKSEVNELKTKIKELKQSIHSQLQPIENVPATFKCNVCSKMFVNEEFLSAHFKRRHESDLNPFQAETDRLQMEIKELKERLNSTEKFIQDDYNTKITREKRETVPNNDAVIGNMVHVELQNKFDHLKEYVERELTVLRDEKYYQEKYEKWFDMVFQRLDNSRKELQEKESRLSFVGDCDSLIRKESSTQTIVENCVESETMTDEVVGSVLEKPVESSQTVMEIDIQKIQNDIRTKTENHLDQMQGLLEKKLSGGFEQIQMQMNSFWKKLNDMELENKQSLANLIHVEQEDLFNKVTLSNSTVKNNEAPHSLPISSSSSSSESLKRPFTVKELPTPAARIVKKIPEVIYSKAKEKFITSPIKSKLNLNFLNENAFDDTSSDDISEITKVASKIPTIAKHIFKFNHKGAHYKQDTDNSATETEQESLSEEPQVKQSNTSTLGQRSLTSLKQIVKDKDVMKGLQNELHDMVNLRLREIGISPNWRGIPERSYKQAMHVVKHQTDLSKKKYSSYTKIREIILKVLNEKIRNQSNIGKENLEHGEQKENKILVIKQPVAKKRIKQKKYSVDHPATVNINNEQAQNRLNKTFTKNTTDKENLQSSMTTQQEKQLLVSATPAKKKVLFDLEDSSSTSKININNVEVTENQQTIVEDKKQSKFECASVSSSPIKKLQVKDDITFKTQKSLNIPKINDGGSTTSLASSILEVPKTKVDTEEFKAQNLTKEDISDWDISDILA